MLKILKFLKPYWIYTVLAPLSMMIAVVCDLYQPALLATIVDKGIPSGNTGYIIQIGLKMIGIAIIGMIGVFGGIIAASQASQRAGTDIRLDLFKKIQDFSFTNLDQFKSSSLLTRLTNDVIQVQNLIMMMLRVLIRAPLLCIGGIVMAVLLNAKLSLILLVIVPVVSAVLILIVSKGLPLFTKVQKKMDKVNAVLQENLSGIRVIKAFTRERKEKKRFKEANKNLRDINVKAFRLMVLTMPIVMLFMNIGVVLVLWFGGYQVKTGGMQVGQIMAYINYLTQILIALMMIIFMLVFYSSLSLLRYYCKEPSKPVTM